jgi:phosphatidylglycerophosphate synthase
VIEPIRDALIETAPGDATRVVAGVPLLVRTALVLQKSGIERVDVVGPVAIPADVRIRIEGGAAAPGGRHLVVGPGAVIDQTLVRAACAAAGCLRWERDGARLEVRAGGAPVTPTPPPAGTLLPATAPPELLETTLLRNLENKYDGYFDRVVHRRLSRPLTRVFLRTPVTPNQVTVIGVLLGVTGGLLLGSVSAAGLLAGLAALLVSGVLDCCDGEIARIKFAESRLGHLLDVTGDTLVHAALLVGIARTLARSGDWPGGSTLALLGVGVVCAFAAISWSEHTEARRHRVVDAWENRVLDGVLAPLTTRDWYVFPIAFAVVGELDALVIAAAWGAQIFWVAVTVLVWRVLARSPAGSSPAALT